MINMDRTTFLASLVAFPSFFLSWCSDNDKDIHDVAITGETFEDRDLYFRHNASITNCIFKNCKIKIGDRVHFDSCIFLECSTSPWTTGMKGSSITNSYIRYQPEFSK